MAINKTIGLFVGLAVTTLLVLNPHVIFLVNEQSRLATHSASETNYVLEMQRDQLRQLQDQMEAIDGQLKTFLRQRSLDAPSSSSSSNDNDNSQEPPTMVEKEAVKQSPKPETETETEPVPVPAVKPVTTKLAEQTAVKPMEQAAVVKTVHSALQKAIKPVEQTGAKQVPSALQKAVKGVDSPLKDIVFYSLARADRSGATLIDMLLAHATAFGHGAKYAGACRGKEKKKWARKKYQKVTQERDEEKLKLFAQLGVSDLLPYGFQCPDETQNENTVILNTKSYRDQSEANLDEKFTKEWLAHFRSQIEVPPKNPNKDPKTKDVAVHIRRGDVQPCNQHYDRYIPNQFYLTLLEELKAEYSDYNLNVTIYTEKESYEKMTDFTDNGYRLYTEDDLINVWRSMMVADFLVMSRSSFSVIPALLNVHGKMIYPIYKWRPLDGWYYANDSTLRIISSEIDRMQKQDCPEMEFKRAPEFDPNQNEKYLEYRKQLAEGGGDSTISTS